jgi:hypothetical protein
MRAAESVSLAAPSSQTQIIDDAALQETFYECFAAAQPNIDKIHQK